MVTHLSAGRPPHHALGCLLALTLLAACSRAPQAAAGIRQPADFLTFSSPRVPPGAPAAGGSRAAAAPGRPALAPARRDVAPGAGAVPVAAAASQPLGVPLGGTSAAARPPGFVGVVLARQAVTVGAEADGRLASISVRVGDAVRRGQELATLSTEEVQNEMTVVEATVSAARSDQRRADLELERARDHRTRRERHPELYSEEDLASARSSEKEAVAALDSAKARVAEEVGHLQELQTRLRHAILRAPIDGRVALRYLDTGAQVHSGTPVVRLISAGDFMLRFAVPPAQAAAIRKGEPVEVRLDSLPLILAGHVSQVAPRVDTASQLIFIEADLEVPGDWMGRLQDGLAGRVTVRG
jgi:RND family efflux transporter MFP subunit